MREWFESLAGPQYVDAILWTLAALLGLVVVLVIIRIARGFSSGTYVAGGRNRKTRLAVMDATAIDSHRRLVLVRRDDVEHLLLIGGAADVVVERDIRLFVPPRRAVLTGEPGTEAVSPRPKPPEEPSPREQPAREPPARPQPPVRAPAQPVAPAPRPVREPELRPARALPPPPPRMRPAPPQGDDIDAALARDLEVSFEPPVKPKPVSLDDEMTKLLGELSGHKRQ